MSRDTRRHSFGRFIQGVAGFGAVVLLAACGAGGSNSSGQADSPEPSASTSDSSPSAGESSPAAESGIKKVGLLMDLPRNDGSFGQETAEGAQAAADEHGLELTIVDSLEGKPSEARSALINLARTADLVIVVANAPLAELPKIAAEYPDTLFATDVEPIDGFDNVYYSLQDWYALGYLAGVAAATATESGTVGFVGGGLIPPTIRGQAGFEAGVADTNPDVKVLDTVTNSFTDPTAAKNAATAQLSDGADVLYSFLDAAHAGAVQAVKEAGGNAALIGVIAPKCDISEGFELGDTIYAQAGAIGGLITQAVEGDTESRTLALEDPDTQSLAFCDNYDVPQEVMDAVADARAAVNSGEVTIPPLDE